MKEDERTVELDFSEVELPEVIPNKFGPRSTFLHIDAYFINGKKIATYASKEEAARKTGVSKTYIDNCLFMDEYVGDIVFTFQNLSFKDKMNALKKYFRIFEYDINGNFIRPWKSLSDAAKAYNIKSNDILRCVKDIRLTVGGRIFLLPTHSIKARLFRINYKRK